MTLENKFRQAHPNLLETYFVSMPDYVEREIWDWLDKEIKSLLKEQRHICSLCIDGFNHYGSIINAPEPIIKETLLKQ